MNIDCALSVGEEGFVTVIDSSEDVLVETSRNNAALVDAERVKVVRWPQGLSKMTEGQKFHQLYCVNAGYLQLWGDLAMKPQDVLRRGKDLLVRNGRVAVLVPYPTSETHEDRVAETTGAMKSAGFAQVEVRAGLKGGTGNAIGTVVLGINA